MDIKKIKKMIDLLETSSLSTLEVTEGEVSIKLGKHTSQAHFSPSSIEIPAMKELPSNTDPTEKKYFYSPMVGSFYASSAPDKKSFVQVGETVQTGQVLCIIEAMKIMNQVQADKAFVIKEILVENGDPIEFEQPIFVIE